MSKLIDNWGLAFVLTNVSTSALFLLYGFTMAFLK